MKITPKLKIIAMTSMSIFSLAVLFIATSAWFTAVRNVKTEGDGFVVTTEPNVIESVEIHPEVVTDSNTVYHSYQEEATSTYDVSTKTWSGDTSNNKFQLGTYSSMSPNHSSLIVLKLIDNASSNSNLSLKIKTNKTYSESLVGLDSNNKPTTSIASSGNPLSSILRFSYFEYDEAITDYDFTSLTFEKKSFYTVSSGFITESDYSQTITLSDSNIKSTTKYIAVVMEYYDEGIQYIYSMNLGADVLNTEGDITYTCDWGIYL